MVPVVIDGEGELDRASAVAIIGALRRGVPPEYGLEVFSVCRDEIVAQFSKDLHSTRTAHSVLRYIDADLGQGKTHLLKLLRSVAFREDFLVSIVGLSSSECPLYNLIDVYHRIVDGLRTRESPTEPALASVMERWLEQQRTANKADRRRTLARLPNGMQAALLAYLQATNFLQPSYERRDLVLRWLGGEALPPSQRAQLQVFENIGEETALSMLAAMTMLARDIGYAGFCILFDEAEAIVSFGRSSQRSRALANLVRIVRQTEGSTGTYFVYAATPSFFDMLDVNQELHPRGSDGVVLTPRPLETECLSALAERVAAVHGAAYAWMPPPERVQKILARAPGARVSDLTKRLVAALDELRDRDA